MRKDFVEDCYKELVKKDAFAAMLFALKAPENQRKTFKKWFREVMKLNKN
ncbi:MAG: hypothetical protein ACXQT3_03825 [Methermicoccaceae archaeon]